MECVFFPPYWLHYYESRPLHIPDTHCEGWLHTDLELGFNARDELRGQEAASHIQCNLPRGLCIGSGSRRQKGKQDPNSCNNLWKGYKAERHKEAGRGGKFLSEHVPCQLNLAVELAAHMTKQIMRQALPYPNIRNQIEKRTCRSGRVTCSERIPALQGM